MEWYLLEEPVPACLSRPNSNLWSFGLRLKAGIKGMGSRLLYLLGMGSRKRAHDEWAPMAYEMWMMELLAAGLFYADAESIETVEAGR